MIVDMKVTTYAITSNIKLSNEPAMIKYELIILEFKLLTMV